LKKSLNDCVGCHSSSDSSTTYVLGTSTVPVVNFTGGEPTTHLAGGNFYWVADAGGNRDAAGHNVLGISGKDSLSFAPGGFSIRFPLPLEGLAAAVMLVTTPWL